MPSFESRDRYITRSRLGTVTEYRERTRTNTFHSLAIVAVSACPAGFDYVQNPRPRGSTYTTIMESGPKRPSPLWFLGRNSIMVVYMDPLGDTIGSLRPPRHIPLRRVLYLM